MSAFRFSLQPLLDARIRAEDEARGALAAAVAAAAVARGQAAAARAAFADAGRALRDRAAAPDAPADGAGAHIGFLADAARCARSREGRCAASESRARERFAAARFERRRVEVLQARAYADFRRAAARAEALLLDEANAARHNSATIVPPSLHN